MPRANQDRYNPLGRIPRTLWAHAHDSTQDAFPVVLLFEHTQEMFILLPDNWNGLDKLVLWIIGGGTETPDLTITIHIGTCTEAYNIHTQTVTPIACALANTIYKCLDLTALFDTVLPNLASRDLIRLTVTATTMDYTHYVMGMELQET